MAGCCIFCKQSIPEPKRTPPEIQLGEANHALLHAWEYFKCPECKKEWSSEFSYEVYSEDGTALQTAIARMKRCGFTKEAITK